MLNQTAAGQRQDPARSSRPNAFSWSIRHVRGPSHAGIDWWWRRCVEMHYITLLIRPRLFPLCCL